VGADWLHADRRTDGRKDMTKLIVTFRNFANALKMASDGAERSELEMGSV
jgi:hypothetical protein